MPSQNIPRQIFRIPTYTESYTPTCIDIKSSRINLIILYFIQYFIPPSSFHQLRAYRLGHFEFKPQTLFLLRSYYKTPAYERVVVSFEQSREPSKDHQGQVSVITACRSLTVVLDPQGSRSATRGGDGLASL